MTEASVGLIGATSLVGECVLHSLLHEGWPVVAFSRRASTAVIDAGAALVWRSFDSAERVTKEPVPHEDIPFWISVAPIWCLPEHFARMKSCGAKRVVTLSSTSRFTKENSSDIQERVLARRLRDAEQQFREWAEACDIEWVILRPTLIYGQGKDKNITVIAEFIQHWGFFPLLGAAGGLRQPVHAQDVAQACLAAMVEPLARCKAYNLSGGEVLTYRDMVKRVFGAMNRPVRLLNVPLFAFRLVIFFLRFMPRFRHWSANMAQRMAENLAFDHSPATRDLGFEPKGFALTQQEIRSDFR